MARRAKSARWRGPMLMAGAVGAAVLGSACEPPPTVHFQVNTFADGSDAAPGDGVCEVTPGVGDCSLRAAVDEANATTTDIAAAIDLPAGSYTLTDGPIVADRDGGSLAINADPAGATVTSDAGVVVALTGDVAFVNASLVGGDQAVEVAGGVRFGLLESTASGSTAAVVVQTGGEAVVWRSSLSTAGDCALRNVGDRATVNVIESTLEGVCLNGGAAALTDTEVAGDFEAGPLEFPSKEELELDMDGVTVEGAATIGRSHAAFEYRADITRSQFQGGLILTGEGVVRAEDTTILGDLHSANSSWAYNYWTRVTVTGHVTLDVVLNEFRASTLAGGVTLGEDTKEGRFISSTLSGDGVRPALTIRSLRVVLLGSIVDGGPAPACDPGYVPDEDGLDLPPFDARSQWNAFSDGSCHGLDGTGNQSSVDPQLGPLADNGGLTMTRMPAPGSPVRDAVPLGAVGQSFGMVHSLCDAGVFDQRLIPRPQGSACDHGAVES